MNVIRVVLVDDSEGFLLGASSWIRSESSLVLVAATRSGEELLDLADRLEFDLVLMDAAMPGMNGFEATRRLKSRPCSPRVVMVTFHATEAAREAARRAGADGFVSKSEFADRLMPVIRGLFDQESARAEELADPAAMPSQIKAIRLESGPPQTGVGPPEETLKIQRTREEGGHGGE